MSTTATARVFNFSSGPAVMPVPVLEQMQRDLISLPGVEMSLKDPYSEVRIAAVSAPLAFNCAWASIGPASGHERWPDVEAARLTLRAVQG